MLKPKKFFLVATIVLGIAFILTIKPDGSFLKPIANLIKKKADEQEVNRKHTLDLQKYRPAKPVEW